MSEKLTGDPSGPTAGSSSQARQPSSWTRAASASGANGSGRAKCLVAPGVGHQAALVLVVHLAHEHQPPRAPGDDHTAGPSRGWPAATAGPQS